MPQPPLTRITHPDAMAETINDPGRRFLGAASLALLASPLGALAARAAPARRRPTASAALRKPFGPVRQVNADVLRVGYVEAGPQDGRPVFLLHGWPYDIHSFAEVTPLLAARGYRVIVPYLRGYGPTRFLSSDAFRNGQPSALALDTVAMMDALGIRKAVLAGFDWGGRTGDIIAALWPERCDMGWSRSAAT
jgi:hypothetical protein